MQARLAMRSQVSVLGTENWELLRQPRLLGLFGLLILLVLPAQRVLELAHSLAQRAAHLGQLLRAEDDQSDGQDDDELEGSNLKGHVDRLLPTSRRPCRS